MQTASPAGDETQCPCSVACWPCAVATQNAVVRFEHAVQRSSFDADGHTRLGHVARRVLAALTPIRSESKAAPPRRARPRRPGAGVESGGLHAAVHRASDTGDVAVHQQDGQDVAAPADRQGRGRTGGITRLPSAQASRALPHIAISQGGAGVSAGSPVASGRSNSVPPSGPWSCSMAPSRARSASRMGARCTMANRATSATAAGPNSARWRSLWLHRPWRGASSLQRRRSPPQGDRPRGARRGSCSSAGFWGNSGDMISERPARRAAWTAGTALHQRPPRLPDRRRAALAAAGHRDGLAALRPTRRRRIRGGRGFAGGSAFRIRPVRA